MIRQGGKEKKEELLGELRLLGGRNFDDGATSVGDFKVPPGLRLQTASLQKKPGLRKEGRASEIGARDNQRS